jgi:hypothetical protein
VPPSALPSATTAYSRRGPRFAVRCAILKPVCPDCHGQPWPPLAAPYTALRGGIFAHPTVAEGLTALLGSPPVSPPQ